MQSGKLARIVVASLGACFTLIGTLYLMLAATGNFSEGRSAVIAMGIAFMAVAIPCFAFLYSRKLARILGVLVLLAFSANMLWLTFRPGSTEANATHQVAAIALLVLLVARIASTFRGRRAIRSTHPPSSPPA